MPLKTMSVALADTLLTRYPDPDTIPYRRWCYVQGYYLCGFEKLWRYTGDQSYFDYLKKFVDQHVTDDGDVRDFTAESMDDMMAGTTIVAVFEHTRDEKYRIAAQKIRAQFNDYPRNSDGGFWHGRRLPYEMWIDGVFMGGMFLSHYGAVIGDAEYCFNEVVHQILSLANHCRKGNSGLFLHGYSERKNVSWADPITGLSCDVWSEGLGWYALILVETLSLMPTNHPQRGEIMTILTELIDGLARVQDGKTGLWYQVVDKDDQPDNWHDTSGSAMFTYCIQRAIDLGYVNAELYGHVAQRGYEGIITKAQVNEQGLVDIYDACDGVCVQDSYADYINYPKVVNAKEAVGGFLWATTIVEKPHSVRG